MTTQTPFAFNWTFKTNPAFGNALFTPETPFSWPKPVADPGFHTSLYGNRNEFLYDIPALGPTPAGDEVCKKNNKESIYSKLFRIIAKRLGVSFNDEVSFSNLKQEFVDYVHHNCELSSMSAAEAMEDYLCQFDSSCVETQLRNCMETYNVEYSPDIFELFENWKDESTKKDKKRVCNLVNEFCRECYVMFVR